MLDAVDRALAEFSRRLASGELDGSGRYDTDEVLAAGELRVPVNPAEAGAAYCLSADYSAGLQTSCTGGFRAARDSGCRSGDLHDSRSGERRYKTCN